MKDGEGSVTDTFLLKSSATPPRSQAAPAFDSLIFAAQNAARGAPAK